jgi:hypothetical protein
MNAAGFLDQPSEREQNPLLPCLVRFKSIVLTEVEGAFKACCAELKDIMKELASHQLDCKALAKDLDANMDVFMNYPGRANFVDALKKLQGSENRGLKRLDRLKPALDFGNILGIDGYNFEDLRMEVTKARGNARLQVSCRSACLIIQRSKIDDLEGFWGECKTLKVTVPPPIKQKLDNLRASQDADDNS